MSKSPKRTKTNRSGKCFICHQERDLVQDHRHLKYSGDDLHNACKQRERICNLCNGRYRLATAESFIRSLAKDRNITIREAGLIVVDYITADYSKNSNHSTYYTEHRKEFLKLSATEQKTIVDGPNAKARADLYIKQLKQKNK